jgi:arylsulfatase A-like enzyme
MLKKLFFTALLFLAAAFTFLLWPLKSDDFSIEWDEEAMKEKQDYLASVPKARAGDSLPNILIILVDDLGLYDMSYYGGDKVQTPHMDGIAHSGVAFDQAYVASPMCSASRAAILTGRYPQRFGFEFQMHDRYLKNRLEYLGFKFFMSTDRWQAQPMEKVPRKRDIDMQGLPPSEITIADMLKARGYSTALIGKWHTGSHERNLPSNFGFEYQYGFFDAHSLFAPIGSEGITDQRIKDDFTDQYNWKLGRKGPKGIFRNYERIEEKEHLTDAITRESIDYIRKNRDRPFFLMAAYNAPHTPLQAPDSYVEMFLSEPDPVKRVYYAMIKQLDDAIGRLMEEMESLGLLENTLVFFLSDNGGATYTHTTDNGPLRGGKITDFEGGIRVPFFMSWGGGINNNSNINNNNSNNNNNNINNSNNYRFPVSSMDVFATIAEVTGCPLPMDRHIDGKDLLHYIRQDSVIPHENLFWQRGNSRAARSDGWKVVWNIKFGDTLLYHIGKDGFEAKDLFSREKFKARELIRLHETWSERNVAPLWPPVVHFREKVDGRWVYFDN